MSVHQLEKIFNPRVIALVGSDEKHDLKGEVLLGNLLQSAAPRTLYLINPPARPNWSGFDFCRERPDLKSIEENIDLLFLLPPLARLEAYFTPEILDKTAAIVISKNIAAISDREILDNITARARRSGTRLLGVNSSGSLRPPIRLNLSTYCRLPKAGKIAFFSQSGAVLGTVLDLAQELDIGFSHVVGVGSLLDVDFGDLIDFVGDAPEVEAILLYLENIRNVKKFISACRSVSRSKPIIAIKSGRHPRIHEVMQRRVFSSIGAGPVYDSAFRRAGIVSVNNLKELLLAGRSLSRRNIPTGDRLGIITNSGGLAIFTVDNLLFNDIEPTPLSKKLLQRLRDILPGKLIQNPVDVGGDSTTETFLEAVKACLEASEFDALIILAAAHQDLDPRRLFTAIDKARRGNYCAITYTWLNADARDRRRASTSGGYIYFSVPAALNAYLYSRRYRHKLNQLTALTPRFHKKYSIKHLASRDFLEPYLSAEAVLLRPEISRRITREYGLEESGAGSEKAAQPLALRAGADNDPEFGPYLYLSLHGLCAEVNPEQSIMLPPLNPFLARTMIDRSPAAPVMKQRSPELNEELAIFLLRLASMMTDCPEIFSCSFELQENREGSFSIKRSEITVRRNPLPPPRHLVIAPYPNHYEFQEKMRDGRPLLIRPIKPEDEDLHHELFHALSRQTNYFRFFSYRKHLSHEQAARFTQIDYDREIAIIALLEESGRQRSIGVNRLSYRPSQDQYEFAIVVADEFQGQGVGIILMRRLLDIARDRRIDHIYGTVLAENLKMIEFCRAFDFVVDHQEGENITFRLDL